MEYELEREELNILNLREEVGVLQTRLQETSVLVQPLSQTCRGIGDSADAELNGVPMHGSTDSLLSEPKNGSRDTNNCHSLYKTTLKEFLDGMEAGSVCSILAVAVRYPQGNGTTSPPFHVTHRHDRRCCVVDWATDDTKLKKGDT